MKKLSIVSVLALTVFFSCNKSENKFEVPDDTSTPTIEYPFTSFSSVQYFIPFGDSVHSLQDSRSYIVQVSDTTVNVVSASYGYVDAINTNSNGEYKVLVRYKKNNIHTIEYDGIKDVRVQVLDSLTPSSILGRISQTGEVKFTVIKNGTEALCPANLSNQSFKTSIQVAIDKHNALHPTDSVFSGCYASSLPL